MSGMFFLKAVRMFLLSFIICLVILISAGTCSAFSRKTEKEADNELTEELSFFLKDGKALYGDLGQIRAVSCDAIPVTVVLYPFLEYNASDISFQEELVSKKNVLRNIFKNWFADRKIHSLAAMQESGIKKSLLESLNKELSLGKVSALYFKEFKIVN